MNKKSIYNEIAHYYDLLYSSKDYKKEAEKVMEIIERYKKSEGKELLEVACGTGKHLSYFKEKFLCTGTDLNQGILNIAKKRVRGVSFKKADMINMDIGREFDVITCLFSSIGYVKTRSNLKKTLKNFAKHLKKGGVVVIEPWFDKLTYKEGSPHMTIYEDKDIKIARLNVSKIKNDVSELEMHYLVGEKGKEVKYFTDKHQLGLFDTEETLRFMEEAGFRAKFLKRGLMKNRGLFVGIKK